LKTQDPALSTLLDSGPETFDELRALLDRFQPTLPILLSNLVSLDDVGITYNDSLEQLLVLFPQGISILQASGLAKRNTEQAYEGAYLSFNLNLNLPPTCVTGFLPPQQHRVPADVDSPPRPPGDLYCRVPQDSPFNVRGARNIPCETKPGKRVPTAAMCESDEDYIPLNDGYNLIPAPTSDPTARRTPRPIWRATPTNTIHGRTCCSHRKDNDCVAGQHHETGSPILTKRLASPVPEGIERCASNWARVQ
jgi:phospholipid/cholesterol/gamma-HCH transport system substrate-binding protein